MKRKIGSVYLAGPIDHVEAREHNVWRLVFENRLIQAGGKLLVYDPKRAFSVAPTSQPVILKHINDTAIRACDALFAAVFPDIPSWGTPIEITFADALGKPIVLWTPEGCPPYLVGYPHYRTMEGAIDYLLDAHVADKEGAYLLYTDGGIQPPVYSGDVGYDLSCMEDCTLVPGQGKKLALGKDGDLCIACPAGYWFSMFPRGSTVARGLRVAQTVVDSGYRGPLYAFVMNDSNVNVTVNKGDRLVQLVLFKAEVLPLKKLAVLPDSERGTNGFGSSGN